MPEGPRKRALVVCGPTAVGKSDLADRLADAATERAGLGDLGDPGGLGRGVRAVRTLVVDSMQVYREIPAITNQARRRPADLVGMVSVADPEGWTVARHREAARRITDGDPGPFVFDAGTGMYLNAVLLDFPMAPEVDPALRRRAQRVAEASDNPRRAARAKELELAGAQPRGSVWEGNLFYETALVYLRPDRATLDAAVARRSKKIASEGLREAENLVSLQNEGVRVNPSVEASIGVRELSRHVRGALSLGEAEASVAARTRRLARRQMRWFDKLVGALKGRSGLAGVAVVDPAGDAGAGHAMHDIMGLWAKR